MSRGAQIKAERRRRNTNALSGRRDRLYIDESKLDRENYHYHLANDDGDRIYQLTVLDDYDVVQDRDGQIRPNNDGEGAAVEINTGGSTGKMRSVLLRKPKQFHNDDKAAKQRHIDEIESAIKLGNVPGGDTDSQYNPGESDARPVLSIKRES